MLKKVILTISSVAFSQQVFALCSNCKAVAEQNDDGWADGLNSAILFLMIPPYIILIAIVLFSFRGKIRKGIKNFVNS